MPERLQQKRTKGWRKPENTVSVARPSKWGNPFKITHEDCNEVYLGMCWVVRLEGRRAAFAHEETIREARTVAVAEFEAGVRTGRFGYGVGEVRARLRGKNLMCFCPLDEPCHADVLLSIANGTS